MREIWYNTNGTCSRQIHILIDNNNVVTKVEFLGGCTGNLQGLAALAVGQTVEELAGKLRGIQCRNGTSCPDQLAKALLEVLEEANK